MNNNSGNVLFLILVGIVLFGALTFAVSQSGDNSGDGIDREEAILRATAFLNYASDLKRAMNRMSALSGCTAEQMNFEPPPFDGTTTFNNTNSPGDNSCHLFHPNGGNLTPPGGPSDFGAEHLRYTGSCHVFGIGRHITTAIGGISLDQCRELNKSVGYNAPSHAPTTVGYICSTQNFSGTFPASGSIDATPDHRKGCVEGSGTFNNNIASGAGRYWYFEVLFEQ